MSKKKDLNQEDKQFLADAMRSVKPLKIKNEKVNLSIQTGNKKKVTHETEPPLVNFTEEAYEAPITSDTLLSYKQDSVSHKILRNLRKGQYNVDAVIDLHGMTVETARMSLIQFLSTCLRQNSRVVLIIHGRKRSTNTPILKTKLNIWLRSTRTVLAFCSADTAHGSQGAIYVLLKRNNEEEKYG